MRTAKSAETAKEGESAVATEAEEAESTSPGGTDDTPKDENAWRSVRVEELLPYGLTQNIVDLLRENQPPIDTLGDMADFTSDDRTQLTDVKGIGKGKAEKIEDAQERYWQDHPVE